MEQVSQQAEEDGGDFQSMSQTIYIRVARGTDNEISRLWRDLPLPGHPAPAMEQFHHQVLLTELLSPAHSFVGKIVHDSALESAACTHVIRRIIGM